MAITLVQILDAINDTLGAAAGMARSESYDELTEGIHDLPMLQVYPESCEQDPSGAVDRTAFRGGVRQTYFMINADLYAQQRAHIGEDMAKLVAMLDTMQDVFEEQDYPPYFDLMVSRRFRGGGNAQRFSMASRSANMLEHGLRSRS